MVNPAAREKVRWGVRGLGSACEAGKRIGWGQKYGLVRVFYFQQNTGHTHNTRTTTQPNTRTKHMTEPLSSDRRLRDDGACHLPRLGGWPRRSQHGEGWSSSAVLITRGTAAATETAAEGEVEREVEAGVAASACETGLGLTRLIIIRSYSLPLPSAG